MLKKVVKLVSFLLLILSVVSCFKQEDNKEVKQENEKKIVWKFGHLANEEHIWHKTALKFAELVNEKTDGKIEVRIYPNEQLGSEVDNLNMIQSGTADLTISGEAMAAWAPKAALLAVPYAFDNQEKMLNVINSEIVEEIKDEIIKKVNVIPLYYYLRAPRNLTSNREIIKPEDLKGLKMRVPNVPLFLDTWKKAGAQPQVMAFSEVFTALQQGVIEAQENPYDLIYSAGFYEVQKYVNETEHVNQWVYVVLGKNQFDSLTENLQKSVLEAAKEAQNYGLNLFEKEISNYKDKVIKEGMIINDKVDKVAFREAMLPAVKESLSDEQYSLYEKMINFGK